MMSDIQVISPATSVIQISEEVAEINTVATTETIQVLEQTAIIETLVEQGPTGPVGPVGPTGPVGPVGSLFNADFAYGDATPSPIKLVLAGERINFIRFILDEGFDGVGSRLSLGSSLNPDLLVEGDILDPSTPSTYEFSPRFLAATDTQILLFITPGAGASRGSGNISLQ